MSSSTAHANWRSKPGGNSAEGQADPVQHQTKNSTPTIASAAAERRGLRLPGRPGCPECEGFGLVFEHDLRGYGAYALCSCQREITRCDGRPPYEYYDEERHAMVPCPSRPARHALDRLLYFEKRSGIPTRYRGKFLDGIDTEVGEGTMDFIEALDMAAAAVEYFDRPEKRGWRGIYLYGDTGCGKTLLSCSFLNEILRFFQVPVRYAKISRDILGKLRASFNPNSETYGEGRRIEEDLANVPALVIDDFGVHKETEWVSQVLYDLIDARYENNLITIITSNESMEALREMCGGRIYSRLKEMCREIHIQAPDYRLRNAHL